MADPALGEILVQRDDLAHRVKELGEEVSRDYMGRQLLLVGVLKGAVFFLADLMRNLDIECELDFMAVSSYGASTDSSGVVRILKDLDGPIEGKDVLIVEDIVDSGLTLSYLVRMLEGTQPGIARGVRPADQARATRDRPADQVHGLRDPESLRDRLRPRPRRALPQPALRCGAERGLNGVGRGARERWIVHPKRAKGRTPLLRLRSTSEAGLV